MTFLAPVSTAEVRVPSVLWSRKGVKPKGRVLIADEDGARRALGFDAGLSVPAMAGTSIEHLARIVLG